MLTLDELAHTLRERCLVQAGKCIVHDPARARGAVHAGTKAVMEQDLRQPLVGEVFDQIVDEGELGRRGHHAAPVRVQSIEFAHDGRTIDVVLPIWILHYRHQQWPHVLRFIEKLRHARNPPMRDPLVAQERAHLDRVR